MLELVDVGPRALAAYRGIAPDAILDGLVRSADDLRGARVLHVNATPYGGGVSELLRSAVPPPERSRPRRALEDHPRGRSVLPDHQEDPQRPAGRHPGSHRTGARGVPRHLAAECGAARERIRLRLPPRSAAGWDPVAARDGSARWIWRCHIDTAEPNPGIWAFLHDYLAPYDAAVRALADKRPTVAGEACDPVCGMSVSTADLGPDATFAGTSYRFCSEACRQRFLQRPDCFIGRMAAGGTGESDAGTPFRLGGRLTGV